jgi:ribonuclease T2
LKDSVVIPAAFRSPEQPIRTTSAQLKKDFVASNPAFAESSLAPYCSGSGRYLKELYLCYSPDGVTRKCSSEILRDSSRSCGGPDFLVRNVR